MRKTMETVAAERYVKNVCMVSVHFQRNILIFRLNKIGKNPNIMSQKDEHEQHISEPESNQINSVVNALAIEASKEPM